MARTARKTVVAKSPRITRKRGPRKKAEDQKLKILYVDDEKINLTNFKSAFGKEYEIITAETGGEALKIFKKEGDIAMIVSDQRMPGMTGVELLEKIYKLDSDPVRMILTAYKDIEDILGAINQGHVFRYILKPWEDKEVRPILKQAGDFYLLTKENNRLVDELKTKNKELEKLNTDNQKMNRKLMEDIIRRQETEEELALRSRELEEANNAMKILLKQSSESKQEMESKILSNIRDLIMPYIDDLQERLDDRQDLLYVKVIKANLEQITSSFSNRLAVKLNLTPRELQIAELVRQGRTSKDIANLLGLSRRTVETYRDNLRRKLNVKNKKQNLRSLLLSIH
ncbi:MAG: response regulator [Deltaproteobacteria bacterium]|jgi:DNA-binding NarL/FixJ family response regulator